MDIYFSGQRYLPSVSSGRVQTKHELEPGLRLLCSICCTVRNPPRWRDPRGPSGGTNKQKAVDELFMQSHSKKGNRSTKIVTSPLYAPLSIPISLFLTLCLLRLMVHRPSWDFLEVSLPSPTGHPFFPG